MKRFVTTFILSGLLVLFPLGAFYVYGAEVRDIVFPVDGPSSFRNDFGDSRGGGTRSHTGIDIIADKMTPLVSAVDGVVRYVVRPEASWGYAISIEDEDGYSYRYLHLNNDTPGTDDGNGGEEHAYAPNLRRGTRVSRGQHIGWVGDSGNAENTVSHLHFEIRAPSRSPINPYDSLVTASEAEGLATIHQDAVDPTTHGEIPEFEYPYVFTQDMSIGSSGEEVRQLQLKLKSLGHFTYHTATGYYGPITRSAVILFQTANGISPVGVVGPKTRAALNEDIQPEDDGYIFTRNLSIGSKGQEVQQLQLKLQQLGHFTYHTATGYYGPITQEAVMDFQKANGISPVGVVGPLTRAALNEDAVMSLPDIASVGEEPEGAATGTVLVPVITSDTTLPGGIVGEKYGTHLHATEGFPPFSWVLVSGSLPGGLTLESSTGKISGMPKAVGVFDFIVKVVDENEAAATKPFRIRVREDFSIKTKQLPSAVVGESYYIKLNASGGTPPYLWKVYNGALPDGFSYDPYEGTIYGSPTTPGFYGFYVGASDSAGNHTFKVYGIRVDE